MTADGTPEVETAFIPSDRITEYAAKAKTTLGTYRPARAGDTVTTAAELDALPVGSVVLSHCTGERARFDGLAWQKRHDGSGGYTPEWWAAIDSEWLPENKMFPFLGGTFTVLFRPDAPQPAGEREPDGCVTRDWHAEAHARSGRLDDLVASLHAAFGTVPHDGGFAAAIRRLIGQGRVPQPATTDDAVERAARAAWEAAYPEPERVHHAWDSPVVRETWSDIARAALAAAGAGEAADREACELCRGERSCLRCGPLAARGDAAPTEVEWGVIYEADRDSVIYEPQESEAYARALVAQSPTDTGLVQRTVSAWREVR